MNKITKYYENLIKECIERKKRNKQKNTIRWRQQCYKQSKSNQHLARETSFKGNTIKKDLLNNWRLKK